jgi:hypothetical protein
MSLEILETLYLPKIQERLKKEGIDVTISSLTIQLTNTAWSFSIHPDMPITHSSTYTITVWWNRLPTPWGKPSQFDEIMKAIAYIWADFQQTTFACKTGELIKDKYCASG